MTVKWTAFPSGTTISGADNVPGIQSGSNVLWLFSDVATYITGALSASGTGNFVKATSPTLVTPTLGVATVTSVNKLTITAPASGSTLTIADGKTLTASNTLTFTGTDSSSVALGAGGTVAYTSNNLSVFAATTSSQLAGVISDETGTGALVFANTPTLVTPNIGAATGTSLNVSGSVTGTTLVGKNTGNLAIFDHYTNVGNTTTLETDLYSDTTAAGQLAANGDKLTAVYGGTFVSSGTATREVRIYFGGAKIFDTGALTLSLSAAWTTALTLIRVSGTVVRYSIAFTTEGAALAAYTAVGEVTGLTLANTNIMKITGQAAGIGAATNDIVAMLGNVNYLAAA